MDDTLSKLPENKQPALRLVTQPNDANPKGDIFGGWLMSQIDIAGAIAAVTAAKGSVSTIAVKHLRFLHPLFVHDLVSFYPEVIAIGTTSVTVEIDVYCQRYMDLSEKVLKVANAVFVYVAVERPGKKRIIDISKQF